MKSCYIPQKRQVVSLAMAMAFTVTGSTLLGGDSYSAKQNAVVMPPVQEVFNWTGFYLGVQVGVAFNPDDDGVLAFDTDLDGSYNNRIPAFGDNFEGNFDESVSFGAHAGYDVQFNRIVVGALVDINKLDISQEQSGFSSTPAFYTEERELEYLATGRLRVGFLVTERLLAYVSGGAAYGNTEYRFLSDTPATVRTRGGDDDSDDWGYALGGGLEARITQTISLGVEYLYTNLGESDFRTNLSGPAAFSSAASSTNTRGTDRDFDFHTVQVKLTYRF